MQEERQHYAAVLAKLLGAAEIDNKALASQLLAQLDDLRDDFNRKVDAARSEMRRLAGAAIVGTRAYQRHTVAIGLVLLGIAVLLGMTVAAAVTLGLVRPVRHLLISEATNRLAADSVETPEIDSVLVVGKTEPQRIFELLGQKGEVAPERLALRDAYVEALNAYRGKAWEKASAGFGACLAITPCDPPSKLFLERIAQFRVTAPCVDWSGVWSLAEK